MFWPFIVVCVCVFWLLFELLYFQVKMCAPTRKVMRCAEIKRVLSDIFLFKNLNEVSVSFWTVETIEDD